MISQMSQTEGTLCEFSRNLSSIGNRTQGILSEHFRKGYNKNNPFSHIVYLIFKYISAVLWIRIRIRMDPELLPGSGSGSGIIVPDPDPAKRERAYK